MHGEGKTKSYAVRKEYTLFSYACWKLLQLISRDDELDNRPHKKWNFCFTKIITFEVRKWVVTYGITVLVGTVSWYYSRMKRHGLWNGRQLCSLSKIWDQYCPLSHWRVCTFCKNVKVHNSNDMCHNFMDK